MTHTREMQLCLAGSIVAYETLLAYEHIGKKSITSVTKSMENDREKITIQDIIESIAESRNEKERAMFGDK